MPPFNMWKMKYVWHSDIPQPSTKKGYSNKKEKYQSNNSHCYQDESYHSFTQSPNVKCESSTVKLFIRSSSASKFLRCNGNAHRLGGPGVYLPRNRCIMVTIFGSYSKTTSK